MLSAARSCHDVVCGVTPSVCQIQFNLTLRIHERKYTERGVVGGHNKIESDTIDATVNVLRWV